MNNAYLKAGRTKGSDECYTPENAVTPLLEFIPKKWKVWCPFDESWSAFYQVFKKNGYKVECGSTLGSENKNFFDYFPTCDVIISNPPYSKKDDIIERLYVLGKPFAMLMPVSALQSIRRFKQFQKELELLVFDRRVQYLTDGFDVPKGNCHFGSAYFCKGILPEKLIFRELKPTEPANKTERL
jgi:hypothetical protein